LRIGEVGLQGIEPEPGLGGGGAVAIDAVLLQKLADRAGVGRGLPGLSGSRLGGGLVPYRSGSETDREHPDSEAAKRSEASSRESHESVSSDGDQWAGGDPHLRE